MLGWGRRDIYHVYFLKTLFLNKVNTMGEETMFSLQQAFTDEVKKLKKMKKAGKDFHLRNCVIIFFTGVGRVAERCCILHSELCF